MKEAQQPRVSDALMDKSRIDYSKTESIVLAPGQWRARPDQPPQVMRFIGDLHGNMDLYRTKIAGCKMSCQVGDMGAGFVDVPDMGKGHRFIRGNHDDPAACRANPQWVKDGASFGFKWGDSLFCIGGARSGDAAHRVEGVSWWRDEEMSDAECFRAIAEYADVRPEIVVSHDCPSRVAEQMFGVKEHSRTRLMLDTMLEMNEPAVWVFGHWHQLRDELIGRTRFICLGEGDHVDLEMGGPYGAVFNAVP